MIVLHHINKSRKRSYIEYVGKEGFEMGSVQWMNEVLKRRSLLLEKCFELLSIPSVLDESTARANAPFGQSIAEALEYMLDLGKRDGFRTQNFDGYAGHIEMGEGEEYIGI